MTEKETLTIKTAMILAAGYGKRMAELSELFPKPLLPIGNQTIIDLILLKLKNSGIQKVIINIHYKKDTFFAHFKSRKSFPLEIIFSEERELLGTGGGIANAEPYFNDETILIINSDILCDISIEKIVAFHQKKKAIATMVLIPSSDYLEYSLVEFSSQKKIIGFLPKKIQPTVLQTGIFTGLQILTPEARNYLTTMPSSVIDELYIPAIDKSKNIFAYIHRGLWIDLGSRNQYLNFIKTHKEKKMDLDRFVH